jgi:uridine phosphorylase
MMVKEGIPLALKGKIGDDEGLIRPMKRRTDPDVGPDAIMAMTPSDLDFLVKTSDAKRVLRFGADFFHLYQVRFGAKATLTLSGPFLGAPQAAIGMENLIALGAIRIWVLGWCGSLQPELRIGDLVIPTNAISEEGTSQHYPIGQGSPETGKELNQVLEESLKGAGQPFTRGTVWTTDAPYRETPSKVREFQKKGVLAVEMEMSALMTLAAYRTVGLAGLLVVSDELFELKWHSGFSSSQREKTSRLAGETLLSVVRGG